VCGPVLSQGEVSWASLNGHWGATGNAGAGAGPGQALTPEEA
jgi:hypothetical protein